MTDSGAARESAESVDVAPSAKEVPFLDRRAAVVHDWFQGYHGAERVAHVMRRDLFSPQRPADVYTFHAAHELLPSDLSQSIVHESRLARLPGIRQRGHDPGRWRYLLPYMPYYFRRLDLSEYDLVISSSHACASHATPRPDATHVVYCYTPMRYAWLPETDTRSAASIKRAALGFVTGRLRKIDRAAAQRADAYVAISTAVQERIARFYGRQSYVIPPPVDVDAFDPTQPKDEEHFLWVHRLVSYKRPELVAEAFRGLPFRLTMVGIGPLERQLRAMLPPNVELRNWVTREELAQLYAATSGFLHVGEEDFGITMVEALASGTPVIALNRGGARDIVRDGVDGVVVERADVAALRKAVFDVAARQWQPDKLALRARDFSRESFVQRMIPFLIDVESGGRL